MPPTNQKYIIKTIEDLLNLHPDQLTRWFKDFQEAHLVARELSKIGIATMQQFTWIDDDKNTKDIKIQSPNGDQSIEIKIRENK